MLGSPVQHSLSPVLHRAAYRALGLTGWQYTAIECAEPQLAGVLAERADWAGFSCTMPLKRAVLRLAGSASAEAVAIGAGNTLLPVPGGWCAENTDWRGIRDALAERGVRPRRVILLGAGGTAQAALAALPVDCEVTALVREPARASELQATADRLGRQLRVGRLGDPMAADLVLSTLPPGVADPLADEVDAPAVLDVVYAGWPTPLARAAAARGATVISGAAVLLHQAAGQVELMTERAAPVEAMRAALRAARPDCGC